MKALQDKVRGLVEAGLQIDRVYDIGAHKGIWSRHMKRVLRDSEFVLFEANKDHDEVLAQAGFPFLTGYAAHDGSVAMVPFSATGGTGDSVCQEQTAAYDGVEPQEIPTFTIDNAVSRGLGRPDFIKIDVQGSESAVLRGARDTLKTTSLILIELPLVEYNEGASIAEVLPLLKDFVPILMSEQHFIDGVLIQFDVLYLRKDLHKKLHMIEEPFLNLLRSRDGSVRPK